MDAVLDEERQLDREERPGHECARFWQVRQWRMVRADTDPGDPDGVADETGDHEAEGDELRPMIAGKERHQREQRAHSIEDQRNVESGVRAHVVNFLQKTTLSSSIR